MWRSSAIFTALLAVILYSTANAFLFRGSPNHLPLTYDELQQQAEQNEEDLRVYQGEGDNSFVPEGSEYQESIPETAEQESAQDIPVYDLPEHIGHIGGLAFDEQKRLVLFHRSGRVWDATSFDSNEVFNKTIGPIRNHTIAVISPENGKVFAEFGANQFYMPHGLAAGPNGTMFVTDVGTHQVIKLDRNFKPLLTLGEKMVPGNDDKHFCKPTDVAVASNGDFFVADGYCNSRIMKFDKHGNLLAKFGQPNSDFPGKTGEFFVPHSLALVEKMNMLCVADRENERIQCFTAGCHSHQHPRSVAPVGTFVTKAEGLGRVYGVRHSGNNLYGIVQHEDEQGNQDPTQPSVFMMDFQTGHVTTLGQGLVNVHALATTPSSDLYVAQLNPSQIVRISLAPTGELPQAEEMN
jgi:sugar lactone lactonase YvrE